MPESGHGSDACGSMWHAPPCSESAAQKKSSRPQRRGLQRSPSGGPEEESPIPSNSVTPFASYYPSDEVQNEAEVRGSTPVSANERCPFSQQKTEGKSRLKSHLGLKNSRSSVLDFTFLSLPLIPRGEGAGCFWEFSRFSLQN